MAPSCSTNLRVEMLPKVKDAPPSAAVLPADREPIALAPPEAVTALSGLLLEAVKDLCEADAASILELDRDGHLRFRLVDGGAGEKLNGAKLAPGEGVAGRVLASCVPEIVTEPMESLALDLGERSGYQTRCLLAAPLIDRHGRLVGVVEALNATSGCFDQRHLDALVRLGTPIANALRAVEDLGTDPSAMHRFYEAVVEVVRERGEGLKDQNDELVESRRAFELDRAKRYSDQKMTGLARMACGIAHEINNPLSVVQSNINTAQEITRELGQLVRALPLPKKARELSEEHLTDLEEIGVDTRDALARIARITDRLMAFGEMDLERVEEVDIAAEAYRMADLFESHGPTDIPVPIEVVLADDLPALVSSRTHVRQVLMEIVDNAVRAASKVDLPSVRLRVFADRRSLHIVVTDNGPGIPEALQNQVFDPFFTTKSDWRATGLGLTAAYGVVKGLKGSIALDSAPGQGTSLTVSLPLAGAGKILFQDRQRQGQAESRSCRYYEDLG